MIAGTDISTPDNTTLDSLQDEDSMDIALEEDMTPEVPPSFDDDLQVLVCVSVFWVHIHQPFSRTFFVFVSKFRRLGCSTTSDWQSH